MSCRKYCFSRLAARGGFCACREDWGPATKFIIAVIQGTSWQLARPRHIDNVVDDGPRLSARCFWKTYLHYNQQLARGGSFVFRGASKCAKNSDMAVDARMIKASELRQPEAVAV